MGKEIQVDMDGVCETATAPDWLTTVGVDCCIAVGVADDAQGRAWLIHSPAFGQADIGSLKSMLLKAGAESSKGAGLRIWACGAAVYEDTEPEVKRARAEVKQLLEKIAPRADTQYLWPKPGDVKLIYGEGQWAFEIVAFDFDLDFDSESESESESDFESESDY